MSIKKEIIANAIQPHIKRGSICDSVSERWVIHRKEIKDVIIPAIQKMVFSLSIREAIKLLRASIFIPFIIFFIEAAIAQVMKIYFNTLSFKRNIHYFVLFYQKIQVNNEFLNEESYKTLACKNKTGKNSSPINFKKISSFTMLMKYFFKLINLVLIAFLGGSLFSSPLQAKCVGRFINPITDVCWKCIFPITIAGYEVTRSGKDGESLSDKRICLCPKPGIPVPVPGIPISFWEPVRLAEITRTPFCLVGMGGLQIGKSGVEGRGGVGYSDAGSTQQTSFYHLHWYTYPVITWLELITDWICLESQQLDVAWMSEFDPSWADDELNFLLNPEAALFGNAIAQAACAADCITASAGFPLESLFWCAGCQGGIYPFSGRVSAHEGGVQASLLLTQKMLAKMHRVGFAKAYADKHDFCGKGYRPLLPKHQYKTQMVYPIPETKSGCKPLGRTTFIWGSGKEFPYKGEDFVHLIWKKKQCCLL